ncbi:hypothetical protein J2S21_000937 [Peribacillus cavernae]|nr:hypothetical protein [Peribacillus cavernae]
MDFTQNQKINQVTDQTIVIGMDIAKRTHYAPVLSMNEGGCSKKLLMFHNRKKDLKGFINVS